RMPQSRSSISFLIPHPISSTFFPYTTLFRSIKNVDFKDGTIEVKVLSQLLKNAPASARGFIGIAFHIDPPNSKFEGIYLRPTNGDRKSTRLNSSHLGSSYAVFCLKKKNKILH